MRVWFCDVNVSVKFRSRVSDVTVVQPQFVVSAVQLVRCVVVLRQYLIDSYPPRHQTNLSYYLPGAEKHRYPASQSCQCNESKDAHQNTLLMQWYIYHMSMIQATNRQCMSIYILRDQMFSISSRFVNRQFKSQQHFV